jgi:hypothetical protein
MKLMRLEPSSGAIANLIRVLREAPDVVVARLDDGNIPLIVGRARLVSILESQPRPPSIFKRLLVRAQARASHLFVAGDRATGVAAAMRWGLALDRIRLVEDDDGALLKELAAERRFGNARRAWHRR